MPRPSGWSTVSEAFVRGAVRVTPTEPLVDERLASTLLPPSTGRTVGGIIRVVRVAVGEPLYQLIRVEDQSRRKGGAGGLFFSWDIRRTYSARELAQAELLHVRLTSGFQPHGEECGTQYQELTACQFCGAGRVQTSPLSLDLRRLQPKRDIETQTLPRSKDIVRSIADEIVIGRRLADILRRVSATGYELRPVVKCNSRQPSRTGISFA